MNNSINLTLDEQFDKDCKVIKLKYEYPGYTGEEKWAIITGLTEEELNEKYAEKTASLRPFIVLDLAFGKARTKFINNENKHYMRGVRSIEPFDYDDELLTAHHPELVVDSFEESFLRNETCQKVRSALATLQDPPTFEKRTYTVSEIQDILGIGRNAAYAIVKKGYFSTVRIGGTIRISKRSFDAWLDEDSKPCQVCDDN